MALLEYKAVMMDMAKGRSPANWLSAPLKDSTVTSQTSLFGKQPWQRLAVRRLRKLWQICLKNRADIVLFY